MFAVVASVIFAAACASMPLYFLLPLQSHFPLPLPPFYFILFFYSPSFLRLFLQLPARRREDKRNMKWSGREISCILIVLVEGWFLPLFACMLQAVGLWPHSPLIHLIFNSTHTLPSASTLHPTSTQSAPCGTVCQDFNCVLFHCCHLVHNHTHITRKVTRKQLDHQKK